MQGKVPGVRECLELLPATAGRSLLVNESERDSSGLWVLYCKHNLRVGWGVAVGSSKQDITHP